MYARRLTLGGRVQGVGFRPFVYRLAARHRLTGWVQNRTGQVTVVVEGAAAALADFARELIQSAPPLARPEVVSETDCGPLGYSEFRILDSAEGVRPDIHIPPDQFVCEDCLAELRDPGQRRYAYPFINCTQCGPRYTIITALPYDRPNTTLRDFVLCLDCRREYENPLDRRFHAQPLACPACGPSLRFKNASTEIQGDKDALAAAVRGLLRGQVLAVRGVGGYHLMCDATNDAAVTRLRTRKQRPHKPLAVMFPMRGPDGLDAVARAVRLNPTARERLADPMRPIVLAPRRADNGLSAKLAPGLNDLGALLPYSPLHYLLLEACDRALVATSGNLSGEPVITDPDHAEHQLVRVADAFLHHNRPIQRPADDPVYRSTGRGTRPVRLGRGNAPLEYRLPISAPEPVLAVGGHMKCTLALAWEDRVVVSPHIGDLDSPRAQQVFRQVADDLQSLYGVQAQALVCDAHPRYASSRWAEHDGRPVTRVLHHHAHASALAGEHPDIDRWLIFTWDGVGYGADGTLWGGEVFLGAPARWKRVASFRPFRPPGGDAAGREPWRSAAALCWASGQPWTAPVEAPELVRAAWERGLQSPVTSAVGRLFDAAAALVLDLHRTSFEGQGPMQLEAVACEPDEPIPLPIDTDAEGVLRIDWAPLLEPLCDAGRAPEQRAGLFHDTLVAAAVEVTRRVAQDQRFDAVGLTGGVFQNRVLSERLAAALVGQGLTVRQHRIMPCNDGGLSFGQVVEWAAVEQSTKMLKGGCGHGG